MGFRISVLAAKAPKAVVLSHLGLIDTGEVDEANEEPLSAGELPNGWTIVWANDCDWADVARLEGIDPRPTLMSLMVHEGVMASDLRVVDGVERWTVACGVEHEGELTGNWPASVTPIVTAAQDDARQDPDGDVDHLFDIPAAIMESLTGYRYDAISEAVFTTVTAAVPNRRRAWWKLF